MYNIKLNPKRDRQMLFWLWRWKVATTASLSKKFFGTSSVQACYRRLMKMKKAKLVETRCLDHDGSSHIWVLTKKGFEVVAALLPPLKERGFKSEYPAHDLIVSSFHQGEWLEETPENVTVFTEQELRRIDGDFLEVHDGLLSSLRRPDGITRVGGRWYSFEVELTLKRNSDYELIGEHYEDRGYENVFWLVPKKSQAERIRKNLNAHDDNLHRFYLYKDFVKQGWDIRSIFAVDSNEPTVKTLLQAQGNACKVVYSDCQLDVRKFPENLDACKIFQIPENSN